MCKSCGRRFVFRQTIDIQRLWEDYIFGKQTLEQLSDKYGISISTVRRKLDSTRPTRIISSSKHVVVLADTTYWGRNFGVVMLKDWYTKRILWRKFVRYETIADYQEGIEWLKKHDFVIDGIVCDGLRGMFGMLSKYRVQMCQFHQFKIVQRYLTRHPELPASIELLELSRFMFETDKESFMGAFMEWEQKWSDFLRERSIEKKTGKSFYVHKRLRSAYLSLKRNMIYLWTWYDFVKIGIPNTNNSIEATFTDLKTKLRNHNGLSKNRRKKFIDEYFKRTFYK